MTISIRLSDKDTELIKRYAKLNNISVSDLVRMTVLEKNWKWIWFASLRRSYGRIQSKS